MSPRHPRLRITFALVLVATTLTPVSSPIAAQEADAPSREAGVLFGLTTALADGETATLVAIPGGFGVGGGTLYLSVPVLENRDALRSEFAFISDGDFTIGSLGVYGSYHLTGDGASGGAYALAGGTFHFADEETQYSAGGGLGYLNPVGPGGVIRVEGRYSRFFDPAYNNTVQLLIGLGAKIG